jgi:ribose/xylose/arabinose/galactoside ABC-type transport system permease subunit
MVLTAIIGAWLMSPSQVASGLMLNPVLTIIIILSIGAIIGTLNGFLVAHIGMNAFIATLAVSIILKGGGLFICKGKPISPLPNVFRFLGRTEVAGIPISIFFLISLYALFYIILIHTTFGRYIYAIGGNKYAAKASGIKVKRMILFSYVISGVIFASAGWVLSGRLNSASVMLSRDLLLYIIAAAVLGGVTLGGGRGNPIGIFGGVLLIYSVGHIMTLLKVTPFFISLTTGMIILFSMLLDTLIKTRKLKI